MAETKIPFPWFVLTDPEDNSQLLVVFSEDTPMVAVFMSEEYAAMYDERRGSACDIVEISDLDAAIEFLDHISTPDPSGEMDHVEFICLDPIDPEGDDESSVFRIKSLLAELRQLNG